MSKKLILTPEDFNIYIPQILAQVPMSKLLFLHGPLGAGKTTLVKHIGQYLGVERTIVSPTFTYIREYIIATGQKLIHLDLYRFVGNIDDILSTIVLDETTLICIEWAEIVPELAHKAHLDVTLSYHDENSRLLVW